MQNAPPSISRRSILKLSHLALQTPHPDPAKIPDDDIVGATVIMIQCLYKNKEFIRIGYYISHEYTGDVREGA